MYCTYLVEELVEQGNGEGSLVPVEYSRVGGAQGDEQQLREGVDGQSPGGVVEVVLEEEQVARRECGADLGDVIELLPLELAEQRHLGHHQRTVDGGRVVNGVAEHRVTETQGDPAERPRSQLVLLTVRDTHLPVEVECEHG